jgi:hypothetical protein
MQNLDKFMMIMKNYLNNVRIGYTIVVEGMEEFIKVEKELLDDHENELEEANFNDHKHSHCIFYITYCT